MPSFKRTFDCEYGRHALFYVGDDPAPARHRTDVLHIVPLTMHPTRVREGYRASHRMEVAS